MDRPASLNHIEAFKEVLEMCLMVVSARLGNKLLPAQVRTEIDRNENPVLEERDLQNAVSINGICQYSVDLIKPVSPGYAASRRWAVAFLKSRELSLRGKTSLSQLGLRRFIGT